MNMSINLISSKNSDEVRTMYTKSDNVEVMLDINTSDIVKELFKSMLERYQNRLEESMRGS